MTLAILREQQTFSPVPQTRDERRDDELTSSMTADALLRSFIVEQIERKTRPSAKLGFAQLDYGRLFVRDRWTLFAIAREIGCSVEDLLEPPQPSPESRVAWRDIVDASEKIMGAARSLPDQLKLVTLLRAGGLGWRKIGKALPGRALFSLADDYERGIRRIWVLAQREVRMMSGVDHPRLRLKQPSGAEPSAHR
jgi:hypothetical protein